NYYDRRFIGIYIDHYNHIDNLIPTFKVINEIKNNMSLEEFRNFLLDLPYHINSSKKRIIAELFDIDKNQFDGLFYFEKFKIKTILTIKR
ncbi:MAG: hypothetical protein NZM44_02510, partial [Candidatus Calescibacterium sp.]|nr:hypothetical protein [Candidatus Calescibacterium sp.]